MAELVKYADWIIGGTLPGSPAWRKAQPYAKQLRELAAEHPEIEAARKQARAVAWDRANSI